MNRLIKAHDLNLIYIAGPGHGGPGIVANTYLEGAYSEFYPNISQDMEGIQIVADNCFSGDESFEHFSSCQ